MISLPPFTPPTPFDDAAAALAQVHPAGLDSSSRTQSVPGRKDARKVRDLARVVKG